MGGGADHSGAQGPQPSQHGSFLESHSLVGPNVQLVGGRQEAVVTRALSLFLLRNCRPDLVPLQHDSPPSQRNFKSVQPYSSNFRYELK